MIRSFETFLLLLWNEAVLLLRQPRPRQMQSAFSVGGIMMQ
jgi:hypothetical protein